MIDYWKNMTDGMKTMAEVADGMRTAVCGDAPWETHCPKEGGMNEDGLVGCEVEVRGVAVLVAVDLRFHHPLGSVVGREVEMRLEVRYSNGPEKIGYNLAQVVYR